MFLTNKYRGYNERGEQTAAGEFLIIFNDVSGGELRCIVRYSRFRQCGHFMMASVPIGSKRECLSGTYGSDGLPIHLDSSDPLWAMLHPIPADLQEVFWKGGGHNCAGSEAEAFLKWGRQNLVTLKKLRKKRNRKK